MRTSTPAGQVARGLLALLLAGLSVAFSGCGSDDRDPQACDWARGQTFLSTEVMECGLGPTDGVVSCNWSVKLKADGTYTWSHSDVGDAGTYGCGGGIVTATSSGGATLSGSIDLATRQLTWAGALYNLERPAFSAAQR
jgi:hypothetical protein